jgi:hypothetical protein
MVLNLAKDLEATRMASRRSKGTVSIRIADNIFYWRMPDAAKFKRCTMYIPAYTAEIDLTTILPKRKYNT